MRVNKNKAENVFIYSLPYFCTIKLKKSIYNIIKVGGELYGKKGN
ncbi:hypothetical protein JOC70_003537 [Clostridium pascui]|nr:hypothetical protein [Clostridium pascui]